MQDLLHGRYFLSQIFRGSNFREYTPRRTWRLHRLLWPLEDRRCHQCNGHRYPFSSKVRGSSRECVRPSRMLCDGGRVSAYLEDCIQRQERLTKIVLEECYRLLTGMISS